MELPVSASEIKATQSEETVKNQIDEHDLKPYLWKPGQSGNPKGRPKGSFSIKELVRRHLQTHPADLHEYVEHFIKTNRELSWQMLEGRPSQDLTSGGEKINPIPIVNVRQDIRILENITVEKKD